MLCFCKSFPPQELLTEIPTLLLSSKSINPTYTYQSITISDPNSIHILTSTSSLLIKLAAPCKLLLLSTAINTIFGFYLINIHKNKFLVLFPGILEFLLFGALNYLYLLLSWVESMFMMIHDKISTLSSLYSISLCI